MSYTRSEKFLRRPKGVTLFETALATIIIGVAITAMVKIAIYTSQQMAYSQRRSQAMMLAENIREMMVGLPFSDPGYGTTTFGPEAGETGLAQYDDVDDFDGFNSSVRADIANGSPVGPIDANRNVITEIVAGVTQVPMEMRNYKQQIAVDPVSTADLTLTLAKPNTARTAVRVTVMVSYRSPGTSTWNVVATLRWVKTR